MAAKAIRLGIFGCTGRVGRRLCHLIDAAPDVALVSAIERDDSAWIGKPVSELQCSNNQFVVISQLASLDNLFPKPEVIIDFSGPQGTLALIEKAACLKIAVVSGTTGLTPAQQTVLKETSKSIPVLHDTNFSFGVNLLKKLVAAATKALGDEFNIEIVEAHHNQKVDAPSGTALALADAVSQAAKQQKGCSTDDNLPYLVHGRQGNAGKRTAREIGMHALRMGSVVGDHTGVIMYLENKLSI